MYSPHGFQMTTKDQLIGVGIAFGLVGTVVGLVMLAANAAAPTYGPPQTPAFANGQLVSMKAFGHTGMVISSYCPRSVDDRQFGCTYSVRFSAIQSRTDTRVFGSDGPIDVAPVALVHGIREYELGAR